MWSTDDDDLMEVRWFYAPEDTKGGRKKRDKSRSEALTALREPGRQLMPEPTRRELFCSSLSDTNFAETVVGHAMVVDEDFFQQWCAGQSTSGRGKKKADAASEGAGAGGRVRRRRRAALPAGCGAQIRAALTPGRSTGSCGPTTRGYPSSSASAPTRRARASAPP